MHSLYTFSMQIQQKTMHHYNSRINFCWHFKDQPIGARQKQSKNKTSILLWKQMSEMEIIKQAKESK